MNVIDTFRLDGRVALLTGAAGAYGQQMLAALVEAGAKVYIAARNLDALETVAECHNSNGGNVTAVQYDQGDEASILALRDRIVSESGCIDILVNNSYSPPVEFDAPAKDFLESLRVNSLGLFLITRAIGDVMAEAGRGSIINIGSIFGMRGADRWTCEGTDKRWALPDYYMHKGGMLNFTRFAASYYGQHNIRCNCIAAGGLLSTNMQDGFEENYNRTTCLGRMANDTDLKGIIVFLASDASAYITGANIPVDGGRTAI